jgi:hypothetical protein
LGTRLIEGKDLPDWNAFESEIQAIQEKYPPPRLLFRGQSDSEWSLTTTLERAGCAGMSFSEYYHLTVARIRHAVETFTEVNWDVPDPDRRLEESFLDRELFPYHRFPSVEFYRYMAYLRHHGFPSPLLDWTYSPYVAAFFAFREPMAAAQKRSIYVYCETPEGHKGGAVGETTMRQIGPYVRSHRRHFRQQSDYTICATFDENFGWRFHPHEPVFGNRGEQDFLWKFNLPSAERVKVLRLLNDYNLNAFSLFDSEESLLETMWFREYALKQSD